MRATKLTATAAAAVFAVTPAVMGQASAGAVSTQDGSVSTFVVKDRSDQVRELEITRGQAAELEIIRSNKRLRSMTVRTDSERELEIIRGMRKSNDELEITRVHRP